MDYKIDYARNARLGVVSKYSENVIKLAMEHAGISQVTITSTLRTIEDQARIMYNNVMKWTLPPHNLSNLDAIRKKRELTYTAPGTAVDEVCWANRSKAELEVRGLMEAKIKEYLNKDQRTSLHCVSKEEYETLNVLDISFISGAKAEKFEQMLQSMSIRVKSSKKYKEIAGCKKVIKFLYREKGCWHIEIPQLITNPHRTNDSFAFPVKIAGVDDNSVNAGTVERLYEHTEKANILGGWFPLGANTVWHGGVHLHVPQRSDVVAMAGGEVVAVKLAESDERSIGHYGSHNFILMKHEITGQKLNAQFPTVAGSTGSARVAPRRFNESDKKTFYSLYMHLKNEVLDPNTNSKLKEFKWLPRKSGGTTAETHTIASGELLETLATRWDTTIQKIRDINQELEPHFGKNADGTKSWYSIGDVVKRPVDTIDTAFLDSLKSGEVVKVQGAAVKAGELLWTSGMYGTDQIFRSGGVLHWEVFSEENLLPSFTTVEDNDENWNMDSQSIFQMVDQNFDVLPSEWKNADLGEVKRFYRENDNAAKLREYACKFISEWAVDVDKGIEDMKGIRSWIARKHRLEPYQWWSKAVEKGVALPNTKTHWHYNPISFVNKLLSVKNGVIYTAEYVINHIPAGSSHRPGNAMVPTYLTIHSTGNPNSTATGERNWLTNAQNTSSTGFHIVVDENKAIECIPLSEIAYHAGDGASGTGNTQSIGVEIVESGDREKTLQNAIRLAAQLLVNHGLSIDRLKKHKDWSGKHCPRILLSPTENQGEAHQSWEWFRNKVEELI